MEKLQKQIKKVVFSKNRKKQKLSNIIVKLNKKVYKNKRFEARKLLVYGIFIEQEYVYIVILIEGMENIQCSPQELISQGFKNCGLLRTGYSNDQEESSKNNYCGQNSSALSNSNSHISKFSLRKNNLRSTLADSNNYSHHQIKQSSQIIPKQSRHEMLNSIRSHHKYQANYLTKQHLPKNSIKYLSPDSRFSAMPKNQYGIKMIPFHHPQNPPQQYMSEMETNFSRISSQNSRKLGALSMGESKVVSVYSQRPDHMQNRQSSFFYPPFPLKQKNLGQNVNQKNWEASKFNPQIAKITININTRPNQEEKIINSKKRKGSMIEQLDSL